MICMPSFFFLMMCMSSFFFLFSRIVAIASGLGQGKGVNPEKGVVIDGKSDALLLVGPKGEVWVEPNSCSQRSSVD